MSNVITIDGIMIRQDAEGRYSFNDLHKAAVAAGHDYKRCQVEHFTRNETTQGLIAELRENGELEIEPFVSKAGRYGGTWGCKELVYAYAMWISPAFHLKVIRAYDQMATQPVRDPIEVLNDPAAMRGLLLTYTEKVLELEEKVAEQAPKVQALDRIATSDGSLCITDAAKTLQVQPKKLFAWLRENRWIYRRAGATTDIAYQDRIMVGLLEHKTTLVVTSDGSERSVTQVRVTPKGMAKLAELLSEAAAA